MVRNDNWVCFECVILNFGNFYDWFGEIVRTDTNKSAEFRLYIFNWIRARGYFVVMIKN